MTVGALLSLGVDLEQVREGLAALPMRGYSLRASQRLVNAITAVKFDVALEGPAHQPVHDHGPHGEHAHTHVHRSFADIRAMIDGSALASPVKATALAIFGRLAEAEGRVHGVAAEAVTFHEVGAVDSIVDIVGTAIGLAALDVGRVYVSPLPLGSGLVRSQHGVIPVPGPATAELLKRLPGADRRRAQRAGDTDRCGDHRRAGAPRRAGAAVAHRGGRLRRRDAHAGGSPEPAAPPAGPRDGLDQRRRGDRDRGDNRRRQPGALRARTRRGLRRRRARRLARAGDR